MMLPDGVQGQQGLFPERQREKLAFLYDDRSSSPSTKCSVVSCTPPRAQAPQLSTAQVVEYKTTSSMKRKMLNRTNLQPHRQFCRNQGKKEHRSRDNWSRQDLQGDCLQTVGNYQTGAEDENPPVFCAGKAAEYFWAATDGGAARMQVLSWNWPCDHYWHGCPYHGVVMTR